MRRFYYGISFEWMIALAKRTIILIFDNKIERDNDRNIAVKHEIGVEQKK